MILINELMVVYSDNTLNVNYIEHLTVTAIDCKKVLERQTTKGYDPNDHVMYIYKNMYVCCKHTCSTVFVNNKKRQYTLMYLCIHLANVFIRSGYSLFAAIARL